jgi:hypothetical protein
MENELKDIVTNEDFSKIQSVAKDGKVLGAAGSLALWGIINIGAWFLLGKENREFLDRITNSPSGDIFFLIYGGLILGAIMFFFATIGFFTRISATIILDGLSLMAIGIFNIIHDFVAISALRPYGYTIEKPSTMWIIFGACQLVWGYRQLSSFGRMTSWTPSHLSGLEMKELKVQLRKFVGMAESIENNIVKASITLRGPFGMEFMSQTTYYTGIILHDSIRMISTKLDDCFIINRIELNKTKISEIVNLEIEGTSRSLIVAPLSVTMFKEWCAIPELAEV